MLRRTMMTLALALATPVLLLIGGPSAAQEPDEQAAGSPASAFRKGNDPFLDDEAEVLFNGSAPVTARVSGTGPAQLAPDNGASAFRKGNDPFLDEAAEALLDGSAPVTARVSGTGPAQFARDTGGSAFRKGNDPFLDNAAEALFNTPRGTRGIAPVSPGPSASGNAEQQGLGSGR